MRSTTYQWLQWLRRWVARRPRRTSVIVRARPAEPPPAPRPLPDRDGPHFLQQLRAFLKPADSGRNAFGRAWKKQRQIQASPTLIATLTQASLLP